MKLLISLIILVLSISCKSDSGEDVKATPAVAVTPEGEYVAREAMTGTDKVSFNYFAVEQDKESGRYWFSLGGVKRYIDDESGEVVSSSSAYSFDDVKNFVVVTDKGIYRQELREKDIVQFCVTDEPGEEGYLRCAEQAYFTFNKTNERPMMILTSTKEKDISFKPIEAEKIASEETIELVKKNLNQDIACKNVGQEYDAKLNKKFWRISCTRIIEKEKSKYGLIFAFGKGSENLFRQGEEGSKTFIGHKSPPSIKEACSAGIKYKSIKILNCWGDRFNRSGSYILIDDKVVEIRHYEYHSVENFFLGELSVGTDEYVVLWSDASHNYSGESKQLSLIQIRDSKLYRIDPVTEGESTFSIQ